MSFIYEGAGFRAKPLKAYPRRPLTKEQGRSRTQAISDFDLRLSYHLCQLFGFNNKNGKPKSHFLDAFYCLICNYRYQACKKCPDAPEKFVFRYSRTEGNYGREINGMTYAVVDLIDSLADLGFITNKIQKPHIDYAGCTQSTFSFTPYFCHIVSMHIVYLDPLLYDPTFCPYSFELPELCYKENIIGKRKSGKLVGINPETKAQRGMASLLRQYNQANAKADFSLNLDETEKTILLQRGFEFSSLVENRRVIRQFADKQLLTHGRIYGGFWQGLPSEFRKKILINGCPTVEIDYRAMHPNLLFTLAAQNYIHDDPYKILSASGQPYSRDVMKGIFMFLLNKGTRAFVAKQFLKLYREHQEEMDNYNPYYSEYFDYQNTEVYRTFLTMNSSDYRKIMAADIKQSWSEIWHFFEDEEWDWRRLTKYDSDIAMEVIKECLEAGIIVLTIHDSFIVAEEHEMFLRNAMEKAFRKVMGTDREIQMKVTRNRPLSVSPYDYTPLCIEGLYKGISNQTNPNP